MIYIGTKVYAGCMAEMSEHFTDNTAHDIIHGIMHSITYKFKTMSGSSRQGMQASTGRIHSKHRQTHTQTHPPRQS